jgi:hypothetical protein
LTEIEKKWVAEQIFDLECHADDPRKGMFNAVIDDTTKCCP